MGPVLVTAVLAILATCTAYPSGAPSFVCTSMRPNHYGGSFRPTDGGCQLKIEGLSQGAAYVPGKRYRVEISRCTFKGFLLQCRGGDKIVGKFELERADADNKEKLLACKGKQATAVTHRNRRDVNSVSAMWTAPDKCLPQGIQCRATVVKRFSEVYLGVRSNTASCQQPAGTPPPEVTAAIPGSFAGVHSCSCEGSSTCQAQGVASYRVKFTAFWSEPRPHPPFPHWSRLVGGTHSPCALIWRNGTLSTDGVKDVAEFGGTSTLLTEMRRLGDHLGKTFVGGNLGTAAGTAFADAEVDRYHPRLSVLSMIAPSPDWFIGVDSVSLCHGNIWQERTQYDLHLWDAGTDSGTEFTSRNSATNPRQPISRITADTGHLAQSMIGVTAPLGRLEIELVNVDREREHPSQPQCSVCERDSPCTLSTDYSDGCEDEGKVYSVGERWKKNCNLTTCRCSSPGRPACGRVGCPLLRCGPGFILGQPNDCGCVTTCIRDKRVCIRLGKTYQVGAIWKEDCNRTTCTCTLSGHRCSGKGCGVFGCMPGFEPGLRDACGCPTRCISIREATAHPLTTVVTTRSPRPIVPSKQCRENEERKSCGTACEPSCDQPTPICTQQCIPDICQCRSGYVRAPNGTCVTAESCGKQMSASSRCQLPPVTGPCRARMIQWFHNHTSGKCEQFVYGGCEGNTNRFTSAELCAQACVDGEQSGCDVVACKAPRQCRLVEGKARCDVFCQPNSCPRGQRCVEETGSTVLRCTQPFLAGCRPIAGCAHYQDSSPRQCCPACRLFIKQCNDPEVQCPPIAGCARYAKTVGLGECCLRCTKRRRSFRLRPGKNQVCATVICPYGQTCTKRSGEAHCQCKPCRDINRPVTGRDGNSYQSACHLQQASCQVCQRL